MYNGLGFGGFGLNMEVGDDPSLGGGLGQRQEYCCVVGDSLRRKQIPHSLNFNFENPTVKVYILFEIFILKNVSFDF